MTACVVLLAALDPDRTTGERSEFMRAAIESALEATGTPKRAMPDAAAILACFEIKCWLSCEE